ncbi:MAG: DUF4125 family protein [Atopobiaceae bacterium]|nr:DUF4125 family protein [Atopobiaceae bacterium]
MNRDELIARIVAREWQLFQEVENIGGRASCQDMPDTFSVMRSSQYSIWTNDMLASWNSDLDAYSNRGANPLTLKYAYMMQSTHPDEFENIREHIPTISPDVAKLIEAIIVIQLGWAEELAQSYPLTTQRGRPLRTSQDTATQTSQETYARGELSTYSKRTLELMYAHFDKAAQAGNNLQEQIVLTEACIYGYTSLDDVESSLANGN